MKLAGKMTLVTGGTTGIGYAAAARFIADGAARVIITGQNEARLAEAAKSLGPHALPVRCDARHLAELDALVGAVQEGLGGRLDAAFLNAGVAAFAPLEYVDETFFDSQFDVNVKGAFFTAQKLLPLMAHGGSVVFNASTVHDKGMPGAHVYAATKAAIRSLVRSLAAELAPRGIRINSVSPGYVPTPLIGKMGMSEEMVSQFESTITAMTPLHRGGTPAEIAAAVAFLASDEASYITGADLTVDGGFGNV